jgi:GNAT superfamily N-acetyltransferase
LWTDPAHRGRGIGAALVGALQSLAERRGVASIEVGIPSPRFAGFDATERFYRRVGFVPLGPRLRLTVTDARSRDSHDEQFMRPA